MNAAYYSGKETITNGECKSLSPALDEVKVKVAYCGICGTDMHIFHGKMDQRIDVPQVIGHEASGTIADVKGLSIGQKVAIMPLDWCGECPACQDGHTHICQKLKFIGIDTSGAFQEYWTVPGRIVLPLPESLDLKIAALIEPLAVALHDIRLGEVKAGDFVTVIGGGPIGALIALTAKLKGADVLVSEISQFRLQMLKKLGIKTVNPMETDIEKLVKEKTAGRGADVVFEVSAHPLGIETAVKLPKTRGLIVVVGIFSEPPKINLLDFFLKELKLCGVRVYEKQDYEEAIKILTDDTLPVEKLISAVYPLDKLEHGIRQVEKGGEVMKILIKCH
jgi:(R,R)-butanediol dehydrogenase / meso-butanediol dehydrogenase / diacetyl reductase